jgi:hypothetical protein
MWKVIGLFLTILLSALGQGCTGVDSEYIEIVPAQQEIFSETSFETLLIDELKTELATKKFVCDPPQKFIHEDATLYCFGPFEYSLGGYESQNNSVAVYQKLGTLPTISVYVRTTYGSIFPWMPSTRGFRKFSAEVHAIIDRIKGDRKLISRYQGNRYQGQSGKSPLP